MGIGRRIEQKVTIIAVISVLVVFLFSISAFAQNSVIPGWVKNNAGWWADGVVTDSDFINALQWLINEEILVIPQSDAPSESEKKFLTKPFEFSMWQPDNWERQQEIPDTVTGLPISALVESSMIDKADATNINIIVENMQGLSFDDYLSLSKRNIDQVYGQENISYLKEESVEVAVETAYYMITEVDVGIVLKTKQYIIEHEGKAYIITYNANSKNYDKNIDQFEEMVSTFKFL